MPWLQSLHATLNKGRSTIWKDQQGRNGLVTKFTKKYLKPGELINDYKAKSGSKAEKALQEIKDEAKRVIEKRFKDSYEKQYDSKIKK